MIKMLRNWALRQLPVLRPARTDVPSEERDKRIDAIEQQRHNLARRVSTLESQVMPAELFARGQEE